MQLISAKNFNLIASSHSIAFKKPYLLSSIILIHNNLFLLSKLDLKKVKRFLMGGISFSLRASGT